MNRKLLSTVGLLGIAVLFLSSRTFGQSVPADYVDNSPATNVHLNRYYNLGWMNSAANSHALNIYSRARNDVSGITENPATGIMNLTPDEPTGISVGYIPAQQYGYVGTIAFTHMPSDNFAWHIIVSGRTSGNVNVVPDRQLTDFYTGKVTNWHDVQSGDDGRYGIGASFRFRDNSRWSFGTSLNYYTSSAMTGSINLNAKDEAHAATLDFGVMYNRQNEDGNGGIYGLRLKNVSFANKFSALHYDPGTNATYSAMYGMTRYIPGYLAAGGGYRISLPSEDAKITFAGELGFELNHAIPDTANASAIQRYESMGAVRNMLHRGSVLSSASVLYVKNLDDDWSMEARGAYILDPYTKAPLLNVGIGHNRFHFNIGYLFSNAASNPFVSKFTIGIRAGFVSGH